MREPASSEKKTGRFRRWLIQIGLIPPPKEEYSDKVQDTEVQRKAKQDLTWQKLRPPTKYA